MKVESWSDFPTGWLKCVMMADKISKVFERRSTGQKHYLIVYNGNCISSSRRDSLKYGVSSFIGNAIHNLYRTKKKQNN